MVLEIRQFLTSGRCCAQQKGVAAEAVSEKQHQKSAGFNPKPMHFLGVRQRTIAGKVHDQDRSCIDGVC
jgi:hypothetical protein